MLVPRRLFVCLTVAVTFLLGTGTTAQAYPDIAPTVSVSAQTVRGGASISFSASVTGLDPAWTASFNGGSRAGSGATFAGSFATPTVARRTVVLLTISYVDSAGQTGSYQVPITLLPDDGVAGVDTELDGDGGDDSGVAGADTLLPDTGGQSFWILIAGAALVVVGGGAFLVARRRSS